MISMRQYNVSSEIVNGVTVVTFKNKTEVNGIVFVKGKYVARIGHNGTRHLGTFEKREEAIKQRLLAESKVKDGTFDEWYKSIKKGNSRK